MNRQYWSAVLLLAFIMSATQLFACDLCGYAVGLNPNFNQNQIGLRYRYRSFAGAHSHVSEGHGHTADLENYNTIELTGRWCIGDKWRIQAFVPYNINRSFSHDEIAEEELGLGDFTVMGMYQLWQRADTGSNKVGHRLFAGLGLGMPTGRYRVKSLTDYSPLIMPGMGAWSGLVAANYLARYKNWGLGADFSYRYLTRNMFEYRLAPRTNGNLNLFYQLNKGQVSVLPYLGGYLEHANEDRFGDISEVNTGGLAAFGNVGAEVYVSSFSVNFQAQIPVLQNLNGEQGLNQTRITTGINFSF